MSRAWGEKPIVRGLMKTKRASRWARRSLALLRKAGWPALYIEAILKATRMARAMERMRSSLSVGRADVRGDGAGTYPCPGPAGLLSEDKVHLSENPSPILPPERGKVPCPDRAIQGVISPPRTSHL